MLLEITLDEVRFGEDFLKYATDDEIAEIKRKCREVKKRRKEMETEKN